MRLGRSLAEQLGLVGAGGGGGGHAHAQGQGQVATQPLQPDGVSQSGATTSTATTSAASYGGGGGFGKSEVVATGLVTSGAGGGVGHAAWSVVFQDALARRLLLHFAFFR